MRGMYRRVCILFIISIVCYGFPTAGYTDIMFDDAWFEQRTQINLKAPEFPSGFTWLNTPLPSVSLHKDLRGHIVLIDFWTYCCINCIHIQSDLRYLEEKYAREPFAVIGCHSAKFDHEKDADHITDAIIRYGIEHPVVIDEQFRIWNSYDIDAWPTSIAVDPEGRIIAGFSGEGHRGTIDRLIAAALDYYKKNGTLSAEKNIPPSKAPSPPPGTLSYPSGVHIDNERKRIIIADTNNNRVITADISGTDPLIIGTGAAGLRDGPFNAAQFDRPHGLALKSNSLYIADTGNQCIRRANLNTRTVETFLRAPSHIKKLLPACIPPARPSPWDLAIDKNILYIAMAGLHQIWSVDLSTMDVTLCAGSGHEGCTDGPPAEASFAQPSGICTDGKRLYVADAESSSIRCIDIAGDGSVSTVAGSCDLFGFGFTDGPGSRARFQHPLALSAHNKCLYAADTYNNAIRKIHLHGLVETLAAGGTLDLYEPGGLAFYDTTMYIADTNNHRICSLDLDSGKTAVLDIRADNALPPPPGDSPKKTAGPFELQTATSGSLHIRIKLGENKKLLADFPARYTILAQTGKAALEIAEKYRSGSVEGSAAEIPFRTNKAGEVTLDVSLSYGYCTRAERLCIPRATEWSVRCIVKDTVTQAQPVIELIDSP